MKTSDCKRIKAIRLLLVALIIVFSVASFSACSLFEKDNVVSIAVDESSVNGYYELGSFDITTIKLIVTYDDDSTNTINAQNSMLTTEAKNSLSTAGEKNITLTYKKQTTTLKIVLVEDGATIVTVTFRDSAGNVLGTKYALQGQNVEEIIPPAVEGQTFAGWVDQTGAPVDLSNLTTSITVQAQYSVNRDTYTVRFVDYDGQEISSSTVVAGTTIKEDDFPSVKSSYPQLEKIAWTESGSVTVNSDLTIKMTGELKKFIVNIWYAKETSPTDKTLISQKQVSYGDSVSTEMNTARRQLAEQGYEIVTVPSASQDNITKNMDYVYIVKTASIAITVYNDADKNAVVPYDSPVKLGNTVTLPATAAVVQNKVLSGWKIKGSKGSVTVDSADGKWVVVNTYGNSVEITPVYADVTVAVSFEFDFTDLQISNTSDYYTLTLTANREFRLNDSISYSFISDLLTENIAKNTADYTKVLDGKTVTNKAVYPASENGSSARATAFETINEYKIISVTCGGKTISPSGLQVVDKSGLKFIIAISKETAGILYTEIKDPEDATLVVGYCVAGVDNAEYVAGSNIFIPSTHNDKPVTEIGANAFASTDYSITGIPSGLQKIGANAFTGASVFGDINLSSLTSLGVNAFQDVKLVSGTITLSNLAVIPDDAFNGLQAMDRQGKDAAVTFVFPKATSVTNNAFKNIKGVIALTFGDVEIIGESAFEGTGIPTINGLTKVTTVGAKAFKGTKLASVDLPAVKSIGANAFKDIETLVTVSLSSAVTASADAYILDVDVFTGSYAITTFNLGKGIKNVTGTVWDNFTVLNTINVAESEYLYSDQGVLYLKGSANALSSVYYPNNKTGKYKAVAPAGATVNILSDSFRNAVIAVLDLSGVTVGSITTNTDTADSVYAVVVAADKVAAAEAAFPNAGVVTDAKNAEYDYDATNKLVYQIVTTTGDNPTTTVTIVKGYDKAESITVPAKEGGYDVTKIADGAFAGFTALTSLTVNATLDGWNSTILQGDTALLTLSIKAWSEDYTPQLSDFSGNNWFNTHNVVALGGVPIGYNNNALENGVPLTVVTASQAEAAFKNTGIPEGFFANSNLTEIYLPSTITGIAKRAFYGCSALKIFEAEGITVLGDEAFSTTGASNKLTEVVLNFSGSGAKMGTAVFAGSINLTKVTINGQVNRNVGSDYMTYYYLPVQTFKGCEALEEVVFEYVNAFGMDNSNKSEAFYQCTALKEFDFTRIINSEIPEGTFAYSGLVYAILTQTWLTSIGQEAFANSDLEYVQIGSTVTKVGVSAFENCSGLIVELSYDNGGFYTSSWSDNVDETAFSDVGKYFVSQSIATPTAGSFLYGKTYTSSYPIIGFRLTDNTSNSINFDMTDVTHTILIKEEDVVAPTYAGYIFAGWFMSKDENTPASFPLVVSADTTLYAKYYGEKQGSLDPTKDVKYVYYLASLPEVTVDGNETAHWYLDNGSTQIEFTEDELPIVHEATYTDTFVIQLQVRDDQNKVTYSEEFKNLGRKGYAIIDYSGGNPDRISIPSTGIYNDGTNGDAEIIVVFAGAFRNCIGKEFTLPVTTLAVLKGYMDKNNSSAFVAPYIFGYKHIVGYDDGYTFGSELGENPLTTVHVPASVEYIEDGVFAIASVENIDFAQGSNLIYASVDAFFGSSWWNKQLENATGNNGFIIAGRLAVAFAGTADVMLLEGGTERVIEQTTKDFGMLETTDPITVTVKVYLDDGTVLVKEVELTATQPNDGVYNFAINVTFDSGEEVIGSFTLNSVNTDSWAYTKDTNLFILDNNGYPANAIAISLSSTKDEQVTVPAGIIKLNDEIFADNDDIDTIILNKELIYIGREAFRGSGLASVRYGVANNEQYVSSISHIGENAFEGTGFYESEKVIVGRIFLKYSHKGATTLTVSEGVTTIAPGAFRGSRLKSVTLSTTTIKEIGAFAFRNSSLLTITLPKGVETIGRGAFANSLSLTNVDMSATTIKVLPSDTFYNAKELTRVQLPTTVTEIERDAFTLCVKLNVINADGIQSLEVENGEFTSGLGDTSWYKNAGANASGSTQDTALKLGKVLVKYVIGTAAKEVYDEAKKTDENAKLTITIPNDIVTIAYRAFVDSTEGSYLDKVTNLGIPNSVTTIGEEAFKGLKGLKVVTFGTGLKEIGKNAFKDLTSLTTAVLPEGLEKIGDGAFMNTKLTTEVKDGNGVRVRDDGYTIPASVTSIGAQAFRGVTTLTVLNLGKKITEIGAMAFNMGGSGQLYKVNWDLNVKEGTDAEGQKTERPVVTLAKNIASAGTTISDIFTTSSALEIRFYVEKSVLEYVTGSEFSYHDRWNVWNFCEVGDLPEISFSNDGYSLLPVKTEYLVEGDIPVPPHNTVAGQTYTFMYWTIDGVDTELQTFERISYPYLVTKEITLFANFYENIISTERDRETVKDKNNVSFSYVSENGVAVISGITSTETLYVPDKITNTVTEAGGQTVQYTYPIKGFSLTSTSVKKLVLTNASNFNDMTENIFRTFPNLETIELHLSGSTKADYKVVETVLTAKSGKDSYQGTFYVVYSNDVATTANYGTKLIAVIGNVAAATEEARANGYEGSDDLDFVFEIPENVQEVYAAAMANSGFKTVAIPSTLTTIGEDAFGSELTALRIPKNGNTVKVNLTDVNFNSVNINAPIMSAAAKDPSSGDGYIEIKSLKYKNGNYGDFYAIGNVLVGYMSSIRTYLGAGNGLVLPKTVNGINITILAGDIYRGYYEGSEFVAAGEETVLETTELTLPTYVKVINTDAFTNMKFSDVLNATEYANLTEIANNVFDETDFYKNSTSANGLYVGKVLVRWQTAHDGQNTIKADTVAIASNAFQGATFTSIIIPESVMSIGKEAFYGLSDLKEVTISNNVSVIGEKAFMGCGKLERVNIDTQGSMLKAIGDSAFENDGNLLALNLPYSVTKIGVSAFKGCTGLKTVTFDGYDSTTGMLDTTKLSRLATLGKEAFGGDAALEEIKIPAGVTEIGESTFEGCSGLKKLEFETGSKLTTIKTGAFMECALLGSVIDVEAPNLLTVILPDSLVTVEDSVFEGCSGLWGIRFGYNIDTLGENVFKDCTNLAKIEFLRGTPPTIASNTFGRDVENDHYRLRIYVVAEAAHAYANAYKSKWASAWADCSYHIYERGNLPTLISKLTEDARAEDTHTRTADIIINHTENFGSGNYSSWQYLSFSQNNPGTSAAETTVVGAARLNKDSTPNIGKYGVQSFEINGTNYTILVVDYDVMTLIPASNTQE